MDVGIVCEIDASEAQAPAVGLFHLPMNAETPCILSAFQYHL